MKAIRYTPEYREIVEELYDRLRNTPEDFAVMYADFIDASKNHELYLVYDEEDVAGIFFLSKDSFGMYVIPEKRKMGVGSFMMRQILELSKDKPMIMVNVIKKNEPAIHLYKKFGFKEVNNILMEKGPGIVLEYVKKDISEKFKEAVHYWEWCHRRSPDEYEATNFINFKEETKMMWNWISNVIKQFANDVDSVVDYGCGNGRFIKPLGEIMKAKVVGVDIFNEVIDKCKKKYPQNEFILLDEKLDIPETDMLFTVNTFCYLHSFDIYNLLVKRIKERVKKYVVLFEPFHVGIKVVEAQLQMPIEKIATDLPEFEWISVKPPELGEGISENHYLLMGKRM